MSDLEKRITAKMVLDDSGYSSTLKGINAELKENKSELKAASSGLEAFGKTNENVNRVQEAFSKQLETQTRKIKAYQDAMNKASSNLDKNIATRDKLKASLAQEESKLEALKKQYGENNEAVARVQSRLEELREELNKVDSSIENNAKRMGNYQSNLNKAESELNKATAANKKFNDDLEKSGGLTETERKLSKTSDGLGKFGDKASSVGSSLTMGLSVPLLGVGLAAAHVGMDFESQMSRVQAISGATGEDFEALKNEAMDLGQKTSFSANEAAEGMENLASAGFNTTEIMEAMPGMLDLAATSGEDLATSSDIAASTLRGFGLAASDAGRVADVLAKNAAETNAAVGDTGEAMKYVAPVAHAMGLSLEEVTASLGIMANAGIKGTQAGTTLRSAFTKLAKPTADAASIMKQLGFNAFDSSGKMLPLDNIIGKLKSSTENLTDQQKQQAIATIFGQEAMSGMLTLIDAGPDQLSSLTEGLENSTGAAKEMADTMQNNTKASVEQALGALETAGIKLLEVAAPAIKRVAEGVQELANKFASLSPSTQDFILKAGMIAIATGPVISGIGKISSVSSGLIGILGKVAGGLGGMATSASSVAGATTEAGLASTGLAGGLAAVLPVALGVGAAAVALGAGIYVAHKDTELMNGSCLKSKEELGFLGNALLKLHGDYAMSTDDLNRLNIKHREWNEKVSPETRKALEATSKEIATLNLEIASSNGLDKVISPTQINNFKIRTDKLFNETLAKIKAKAPVVQKEMANSFKADDGTLDKNEQTLMQFFSESQNKQITEIKGYQAKINAIYKKQMDEHRNLKKSEVDEIAKLTQKMGQVSLNNTVKGNSELLAAQADFNVRMKNLDMNGLSKLLEQKAQERDKSVKISNDKYDKEIELLKLYRPQMNAEQQKACDDQINKLTSAKYTAEGVEKSKYQSFLDAAKKKYPELANYIDQSNGKIMTEEQQKNKKRLDNFTSHMDGMNQITKTGYYKIRDTVSGEMENCYVEVDSKTGQITAAWESGTYDVLGNPMKPDAVIDPQLVDGSKFQPIVGSYKDKKNNIETNPVKPKVVNPSNPFQSIINDWGNAISYVVSHPIKSAVNFFGGSDHNWTGNSNFKGGYTTLHERGEELYDLPQGTRIYNHEMSEQLVLETARKTAEGIVKNFGGNQEQGNIIIPISIAGESLDEIIIPRVSNKLAMNSRRRF